MTKFPICGRLTVSTMKGEDFSMKMQRAKDLVTGAIISALVVGVTPAALAKTGAANIPVQYSDIKVVVDGKELSTSKEPFIYDGTTYLPLRAVAEAVGKEVSWDNAAKVAYLGAKPTTSTNTPQTQTPVQTNNTTTQTMGQKNALNKAKDYLYVLPFSRESLIEQLERYDKYSHEDAVYAVDNCGADWNEQAARKAKDYLEILSFSKSGLIEQLERYDGFTHEQAVYGAEQNGY